MKKVLLILAAFLVICTKSYSSQAYNTILPINKCFFNHSQKSVPLNSETDIKKILCNHLKYSNQYNLDALKSLYADTYTNADGFNKETYFDLIKKTWDSYPDIKYGITIKNINIDSDNAIAQVSESATATTNSESGIVNKKGLLESASNNVYYFKKIDNKWLITSDYVLSEKTFLKYGSAQDIKVDLTAPCQISADTQYTSTLEIVPPKNSLIIASIGKEDITYPQTVSKEVFRKLPQDGVLQRVLKSNNKNINEYSVASFGITKAEITGTEIKVYVTGLGFIMTRINVIPKNEFIKVAENEQVK